MNSPRSILSATMLLAGALVTPAAELEVPGKPATQAAKFLFAATDVVMNHDLQPPTRQEMIYHCLKRMFQLTGGRRHPKLSQLASAIQKPADLAQLIHRFFDKDSLAKMNKAPELLLEGLRPDHFPRGEFGGALFEDSHESMVTKQFSENRYVGIGIALGTTGRDKDMRPQVMQLLGKGPAYHGGLKQRDILDRIDGRETKGIPLGQVIRWLRGAEGTRVKLLVRQPGEQTKRTLNITRAVVPIPSAVGHTETEPGEHDYQIEGNDIAYVRLNQITGATLNELQQLDAKFIDSGIKAVILDLRHTTNPRDGSVHHPIMLADGLLAGGKLGHVEEEGLKRNLAAGADSIFQDLPVAALIGRSTGSAAAWVAAALQDNERASLIGRSFHGNMQIQAAVPIPDYGGTLRLHTSRFQRAVQPQQTTSRQRFPFFEQSQTQPTLKPDIDVGEGRSDRPNRNRREPIPALETAEVKAAIHYLKGLI